MRPASPQLAVSIADPVFIFALVMMIILVAPLLSARLKVPGIIGLIVAGIIVGPNAAGLLARDQTIELLGTVGLLYIMFIAGLEIDLTQFSKYRNRSVVFGTLTFVLPQGIGTLLAVFLLGFTWTSAILLASMFASHTLLAYPSASRLGIVKSEPVTTTVGGTIITDTAALIVLAIVAGSVEGTLDAAFWVRLVVAIAAYGVLVFWGLPRVGRWFFRRMRAESSAEFVFVLAALFLSALLSEVAGMEPIIGAFMAGLALNRLIPDQSILMSRINFVGNALFIPFFLISVGMLVDLRLFIGGTDAWMVAGFMVGTVIGTKFLAARLTERIFDYAPAEGMVVFGLSVAQAAATLAVVIVGYDLGVFGDSVLNGTIAMILVTCLLSPWIVERYGRRMAVTQELRRYRPSDAPQRILVPLSNPATATSLMDVALIMRQPGHNEPIYPLVVVRGGADADSQLAAGEKLLGHAVAHGTAAGIPVQIETRIDANAADGIERAIRERRITDVVIGWTGEVSAGDRVFGTVLDQLLDTTHEKVLVCKIASPINTIDRILLGVPPFADREPGFPTVVRDVKLFASQLGADLEVVATRGTMPSVRPAFSTTKPDVTMRFAEIETWSQLSTFVGTRWNTTDLLALLSARSGTISWRPTLDRLPRLLAQRIPESDFVVIYPPEPKSESIAAPNASEVLIREAVSRGGVVLEVRGETLEAIFESMLRPTFGNERQSMERAREVLQKVSSEYRPELQTGVAFYHAASQHIAEPTLLVAISRAGVRMPNTSGPIHVIFLAFDPAEGRSSTHLQLLAAVANVVRDEETVRVLVDSETEDDAYTTLYEAAGR